MTFLTTWAVRLAVAALIVAATLVIGGAIDANRRLPDLKPWHRLTPDDLHASEMGDDFTLERLLDREDEVFRAVRDMEAAIDAADRTPVNRYAANSITNPSRADRDWNRTFELEPEDLRGGALLVHGLTDSPYSMRAVAEVLQEAGFYTLALRMPGHGTLPAGLIEATWQDWMAAVRVGARHVRQRVGNGRPLVIVGYSNGGALAVKYALDALDRPQDPRADGLLLMSPMIGVSPTARLAWWISRLGVVPYFEKARWLDVLPEYNPFKYNSFPANAAFQTASLTATLQKDLAARAGDGSSAALPPILTFQSIVDATVNAGAILFQLYDPLPANGSELVVFDVNHRAGIDVFMRPEDLALLGRLLDRPARTYRQVIVTNASASVADVVARTIEAGSTQVVDRDIGLAWPPEVFSLTHIGVPFPMDDPLYGADAPPNASGLLRLGRLSPRGERAVLTVSMDTLMRLSSNPFFPFLAERTRAWVSSLGSETRAE